MKNVIVECPACDQPIETTKEAARAGILCPACGMGFVPDKFRESINPEWLSEVKPSPAIESQNQREKIREQARGFVMISILIFFIGVLFLFGGIYDSIGALNGGDAPGGGLCWILMSAAFGLAFWLYLVGQVIHIRANTER